MDDDVNVDVDVNVYVVYADDNGDANVNVDIDCIKERLCETRRGCVTREKLHGFKSGGISKSLL